MTRISPTTVVWVLEEFRRAYKQLKRPMSMEEFCLLMPQSEWRARKSFSELVKDGDLLKIRHGNRVLFTLPEGDVGRPESNETEKRVYKEIASYARINGCGITISQLSSAATLSQAQVTVYISRLYDKGMILRIPYSRPGSRYTFLPNTEEWAHERKNSVAVSHSSNRQGGPKGYYTRGDLLMAEAKVSVGDVFRAAWIDDTDTVRQKFVRVKLKSRHLILCEDGSTYSYKDLAAYYRDPHTLLGLWRC